MTDLYDYINSSQEMDYDLILRHVQNQLTSLESLELNQLRVYNTADIQIINSGLINVGGSIVLDAGDNSLTLDDGAEIIVKDGGNITVEGGGDINISDNGDINMLSTLGGVSGIYWFDTDDVKRLEITTISGTNLLVRPTTNEVGDIYIGSSNQRWDRVYMYAADNFDIFTRNAEDNDNNISISLQSGASFVDWQIDSYLDAVKSGVTYKYSTTENAFKRLGAQSVALGTTASPWSTLILEDGGYIGSASDTDAIQIEADGDVLLSQKVGIGVTPTYKLDIKTSSQWDFARFISTHDNATGYPKLAIGHLRASQADNDYAGGIIFQGYNDAGTPEVIDYAGIQVQIVDITDGTEDGVLRLQVMRNGSLSTKVTLGNNFSVEGGNILVDDGAYIGSDSVNTAIQIEADGDVVFSQDIRAVLGTFQFSDTTAFSSAWADADEYTPTGSDALYLYNTSDSADYTGIMFRTRETGAGTGKISVEWQSAGVGDFIFSLRDGSDLDEVLRLGGSDKSATFSGNITLSQAKYIYFDSTDTYIGANTDDPEDLVISADQDLHLTPDNATTVGDGGSTNYASFANDGELTLAGTARVYKNKFIRVGALGVGGANPASETVNASGFAILEFADAADDYGQANINVPADMDVSADAEIKITWSVPNTSANMTWGYGYNAVGENEDTEGTPTTGTTQVTSSAVADGKTTDILVTIPGGTLAQGDLLQGYFYRDVSEDTYGNPVAVHGMAMKYVSNKLGVGL
jgi:hypothetical protein